MLFVIFGLVQGGLLRKAPAGADPTCKTGIVSTDMFSCCPESCGACDDKHPQCQHEDVADLKQGGCCPTPVKEGPRSCDVTSPPCALGAEYRNPPSLDSLKTTGRHAGTDCNEAIPTTDAVQFLATAFVKFEGKSVSTVNSNCGTYGTAELAAAACSSMDDCMGFQVSKSSGTPDCLHMASEELEELSDDTSNDLYLKRETSAGDLFSFVGMTYGACSATCGGGTQTATLSCKATSGVDAKLGMCSLQVAMNEDAEPATSIACNVAPCPSSLLHKDAHVEKKNLTLAEAEKEFESLVVTAKAGKRTKH